MIEELVERLAELQEELEATAAEVATDERVVRLRVTVNDAAKQLDVAKIELSNEMIYYEATCERLDMEIDDIEAQIIDEWDGDKKTMQYPAGTLKFRQSGSLKIHDEAGLLDDILDRMSVENLIKKKYLKGFNLTAVKKYMGVHDLPMDVAGIEYKTTVKLVHEDTGV